MTHVQHHLFSLADKSKWDASLIEIAHSPAHTWAYNEAISHSSSYPIYLYVGQTETNRAVCPIMIRNKFGKDDIVTPYGFAGLITSGSIPEFHLKWHEFFSNQQMICGYIALHPLFSKHSNFTANEIHQAGLLYCLDLNTSIDTILMNMSKTHRYELRKPLKSSLRIITDKKYIKQKLFYLYQLTLQRVDASQVYYFSKITLEKILNSEFTIAVGIEENNTIEAVSLFTYNEYIADYFLNASTQNGRQYARQLVWEAIQQLKQHNIPQLNLGGGVKQGDHLEQFKRRFGGTMTPYQVLKQIFRPDDYINLCQLADNLNTTYFPQYY